MKRIIVVSCVIAIAVVATVYAKMSKYSNYTYSTSSLTTISGAGPSAKVDTIWLNRQAVTTDGSVPERLNLRQFSGFRTYVTVGPMAPADTAPSILKHNAGVVDSIYFVVKKKLGGVVSLVDSTAATVVRLRSASKTQLISFLIGSGATDTLCADELFGILRVSDTTSDTAGIVVRYPISTETHFKE